MAISVLSKKRAYTGQAGIQRSQCVQVGSSMVTNRSDKSNALTGHIATQAAQPKHRPSFNERISPARLAIGVWEWFFLLKPTPTPLFPLESQTLVKEAIKTRILIQLVIFIEPISLLAHSH